MDKLYSLSKESLMAYYSELTMAKRQLFHDCLSSVRLTNDLTEHHLFFAICRCMRFLKQDDFQGRDLFAGPIHGVLCSSRVTFLEPFTMQLPVSFRVSVVSIPHPSVCLFRISFFFLCSKRETMEWTEISDELENPTSYDGEVVKFKVRGFTGYVYRR